MLDLLWKFFGLFQHRLHSQNHTTTPPITQVTIVSDTSNTGTQLRGFDLVLALPQYYINFKSSKLLHNGKTSDGKIIEKVSLGTDGTPFLTGTVSHLTNKLFIPTTRKRSSFR